VPRWAAAPYRPGVASAEPIIAVVDDEPSVRTMLGRLLRLAHHQVAAFASGEAFLASLATRRPACAVLDIHMPGLSGFDVQSRMHAEGIDVPVVFITASDDVTLDRSAAALDAVRLLRKPFSSVELLAAVDAALGRAGDKA
jgi:FixJ family two-component response regulator